MMRKLTFLLLCAFCAVLTSVQAQAPSNAPLPDEPGEKKATTRKIPPAPQDETAVATSLPAPSVQAATTPPPSSPSIIFDEETAKTAADRSIPAKPRDESAPEKTAAGSSPAKPVRKGAVFNAGPGGEEKPPLRKVPAKPVNEGQ